MKAGIFLDDGNTRIEILESTLDYNQTAIAIHAEYDGNAVDVVIDDYESALRLAEEINRIALLMKDQVLNPKPGSLI